MVSGQWLGHLGNGCWLWRRTHAKLVVYHTVNLRINRSANDKVWIYARYRPTPLRRTRWIEFRRDTMSGHARSAPWPLCHDLTTTSPKSTHTHTTRNAAGGEQARRRRHYFAPAFKVTWRLLLASLQPETARFSLCCRREADVAPVPRDYRAAVKHAHWTLLHSTLRDDACHRLARRLRNIIKAHAAHWASLLRVSQPVHSCITASTTRVTT